MKYSAESGVKVSLDFFLFLTTAVQGPYKILGGLPIASDDRGLFHLGQVGSGLQVTGIVDIPDGSYRIMIRLRGRRLRNIAIHNIEVSHGSCREPSELTFAHRSSFYGGLIE